MFESQEELWQTIEELISSLKESGHSSSSRLISDGYQALNGLTDGWGDFLDSIKKVQKNPGLSASQKKTLGHLHDAAYNAVYRRKPGKWWKFW